MAKRKSSKKWGSGRKVHSGRQIVRYQPGPMVVVGGGSKRRASPRRRRSGDGGGSPTKALVAGAVAGAAVIYYLRTKHGQELTKNSQFIKDHGFGPHLAVAGYALTRVAPKYGTYGRAAMTVGAFLAVAKKMNESKTEPKVSVAGPNLEDIKRALTEDE